MWDKTRSLRDITPKIFGSLIFKGVKLFFYQNLCNSFREGKNEINKRTKCVKQKLLKIIKVNIPIFFLFWRKNEGARVQKNLYFSFFINWLMKNPFLGPSSIMFEISDFGFVFFLFLTIIKKKQIWFCSLLVLLCEVCPELLLELVELDLLLVRKPFVGIHRLDQLVLVI